jgi:hypothetical protein
MRDYRRFTFAALTLLVGSVALLAGSIALRQSIPDEYIGAQRAYLAEHERLLAEFDSLKTSQRIVLIGSSPVIMGLSAQQIETATGIPTRNLAMDASRAVFEDYAATVVAHIRPGDVAIIANPNLRKLPEMQLPLRCVTHFGFECIRKQSGFSPHLMQDALVLFTNRSFGDETLTRTTRGDFAFLEQRKFKTISPKFNGSFPKNGVDDIAKLAMQVRRRGGCPIFVLTPLLPRSDEIALWQNEFTGLWREIDNAGLHDIVVEDSPLWSDPTLFHHDEHMSERGRDVWSQKIIAKLHASGLPGRCGQVAVRS